VRILRKDQNDFFAQVLDGDTVKVSTFKRSNVAKTWQSYKLKMTKSSFELKKNRRTRLKPSYDKERKRTIFF